MKTDLNEEKPYGGRVYNGFMMLTLTLMILLTGVAIIVLTAMEIISSLWLIAAIPMLIAFIIMMCGFCILQPNQSRVMIFFGKYRGTIKRTGYFWYNPFMDSKKISLRIRNMDIDPIKVNDKIGNPVMIGMVLVWKIRDTYRAVFDIDETSQPLAGNEKEGNTTTAGNAIDNFVRIQSDAALREVTGQYAYDNDADGKSGHEITLRSGGEEINDLLEKKLNERLAMAGIEVVEARLNYLAYAPEIAAVMLRRQQASAIIAAREKIVEGAVSMVKMALDQLSEEQVVELDEERKASMVSNLLVVLCADEPAQPVLNTGTLYN